MAITKYRFLWAGLAQSLLQNNLPPGIAFNIISEQPPLRVDIELNPGLPGSEAANDLTDTMSSVGWSLFEIDPTTALFGPPLNIQDFGGIANGIDDNTAAFNAAFTYINEHGGSLYVPTGFYRVQSACNSIQLINRPSGLRVYGDGASSQILIDQIGDNALFEFVNSTADRINFRDIAFRSYSASPFDNHPLIVDCGSIIKVSGSPLGGLLLERCSFIALFGSSTTHLGLVECINGTFVKVSNCTFGGCAGTSTIYVNNPYDVTVEHSRFIDYYATIDNTAWSKSPSGITAWIMAEEPLLNGAARIFVKNCFFDEAAENHIRIGKSSTDIRFASVTIEGCYSNISNAQNGHLIQYANQVNIKNSTFGYAVSVRPAITLVGVGQCIIDQCEMFLGATDIVADTTTRSLVVKNSTGYTLNSSAQYTTIEIDGISSTNNAFPAPFPLTLRAYDYNGTQWIGVVGSGTSGGRNMNGITAIGANVDGYDPPEWDGVTSPPLINNTDIANIISTNAYCIYAIFNINTAVAFTPDYFQPPFIIANNAVNSLKFGFTASGVTLGHYDGTHVSITKACATGGWHFAFGWYDGTNLNLEVDGDPATPVAAGNVAISGGGSIETGVNPNSALILDGRIMELAAANQDLSSWRETIRASSKLRYPSMALP